MRRKGEASGMDVLSFAEKAHADEATIASGTSGFRLMQSARQAVARVATEMSLSGPILVIAGRGNRGRYAGGVSRSLRRAWRRVLTRWAFVVAREAKQSGSHNEERDYFVAKAPRIDERDFKPPNKTAKAFATPIRCPSPRSAMARQTPPETRCAGSGPRST